MHRSVSIFLIFLLASCEQSESKNSTPSRDERIILMNSIGENVIVPMLSDLIDTSGMLTRSIETFCSDPQPDMLDQVKNAWNQTRHIWEQTVTIAYGPYDGLKFEFPSMNQSKPASKIDFGPLSDDSIAGIEEKISGDFSLNVFGYLEEDRGLPAIEYLIFFEDEQATLGRFREQDNMRRCTYLLQAAQDVVERSTDIYNAWNPEDGNFLGVMTFDISIESEPYPMLEDSYAEFINRLWISLANIRKESIQIPLGIEGRDRNIEEEGFLARVHRVDSRWSERSFQNIRDNLKGIENFYTGSYGENQGLGIRALLRDKGSDAGQVFETRLREAYEAIDAFEISFTETLLSDPMKLYELDQIIRAFQTTIQTDILSGLSTRRTINDNDGD